MARTWLSQAAEALGLGIPAFVVALALLAMAGFLNYSRKSALPRLRRFSPLRPYGLLFAVFLPATAACGRQGFNPTATRPSVPGRAAVSAVRTPSTGAAPGTTVTSPAELTLGQVPG